MTRTDTATDATYRLFLTVGKNHDGTWDLTDQRLLAAAVRAAVNDIVERCPVWVDVTFVDAKHQHRTRMTRGRIYDPVAGDVLTVSGLQIPLADLRALGIH